MASEYDLLLDEPPKDTASEYSALLTEDTTPAAPDVVPRDELINRAVATTSLGSVIRGLYKARNIGIEALGPISPEMSDYIFKAHTVREEEKSQPLVSPEIAKEFLGELPPWAGGNVPFVKGATESLGNALSSLTNPAALAQLPAFAVPGVAEMFAANVAADIPKQAEQLGTVVGEHGFLSKEAGAAFGEAGIQDLMGLAAAKTSTGGRFISTAREIAKAPATLTEALAPVLGKTDPSLSPEQIQELLPSEPIIGKPPVQPTQEAFAPAPAEDSILAPPTSPETTTPITPQGTRIAGPALVDTDGNIIAQGKLGDTHADLMNRAIEEGGPAADAALEAFTNDAQHVFVDDQGNVLNREQAAPVGVASGQLPQGTERVQSEAFVQHRNNQLLRASELLSDPVISDALSREGLSGLNMEQQGIVKPAMLAALHDPEIFGSIVKFLPVDVMDVFASEQLSTQDLLGYKTMSENARSVIEGNLPVTSSLEPVVGQGVDALKSVSSTDPAIPVTERTSVPELGGTLEKSLSTSVANSGEQILNTLGADTSKGDIIPVEKSTNFDEANQGNLALHGAIASGAPRLNPTTVAAATRPLKSVRQIITDLAKGLDVPIRFGRLRTSKFGGYFMSKANLIASKFANDLVTVTHEVGHKIDREFLVSADKTIQSELNRLGDPTTPGSMSSWTKSKTLKYKHGEGVAEFIRYWLTDPAKALKDAPATHAAFETILDANKDLGDTMREAQNDIATWRASEAQTRLRSHISVGDNPNKTRYTLSQLTRDLVDDLHILRMAVDDAARRIGGDIDPSKNPYLLARNLRGSYGMADTFIRSGVTDFKTKAVQLGTSLEDALKPVSGRINDFRDFIVASRAKELMRQGRETGLLANDVAAVVDRFKNDPDFQKAFQAVKLWNAHVLKYAVDSGLVTPQQATAMLKMNHDYVPFHRVFEVGAGESSSQASLGTGSGLNAGKPGSLKKLTGSRREIVDPIETMIKNAYAIITASEKAAMNIAVADLSRLPDMGKWVEQVAGPKEQVRVGIDKIKQQLEDAGADVENLPDDLALTFYRQAGEAPFGENTIRIVRNGKPEFYRLNSDLFDTFHALDLEDSGKLVRMLASPAQLLRSGVVLEPSFAFANAIRDTFSAAVIGKYGAVPFETTIRGIGAMIGNPKLVAEWAASGGKSAIEANYFDRAKLQDFIAEKITKDLTPAERALVIVKSPLTALRWLTGLSEEATRIGEYQIAYNKLRKSGLPEGEARRLAAFEARDRQDFAKGGAKTKIVRHMAAFWNASLQANVKLAQTFKERPIRTLLQGAAFVTIPKMLEQAVNYDDKDYWDRPQWERDLFFLIPAGKDANGHTRFIRIPTPFEVGVIFGTLPGRVVQWAKQHDPKALTTYFNTLLQNGIPNPIPQSVQAVFEDFLSGKQGWDVYRGRPIVPDSLANQPPELQYTEQTSRLAKEVGKRLGYSPMKIDHIIAQTTGGLGKVLSGQQIPGKRFVTTPLVASNQSTENFYATLDQLRQDKKRSEAAQTDFDSTKLSAYEKASRRASDLRREMHAKDTEAGRKTEIQQEIYDTIQSVISDYP